MPTKTKAAAVEPPVEEFDPELDEELDAEEDEELDPEESEEPDAEEDEEPKQPVRLVGQELLDFYAEQKQAGKTHADIAYNAGYYTVTKKGQERVMAAQFNEAYLEAQGVEVGGKSSGPGRSHAGLTRARVSGQGILLVSQLATRHVGANEGAVFEVSYPGDGAILLTPTGEVKPVVPRKQKQEGEAAGTPLLNQPA